MKSLFRSLRTLDKIAIVLGLALWLAWGTVKLQHRHRQTQQQEVQTVMNVIMQKIQANPNFLQDFDSLGESRRLQTNDQNQWIEALSQNPQDNGNAPKPWNRQDLRWNALLDSQLIPIEVRYRYRLLRDPDDNRWIIEASGDLDGDGKPSRFWMHFGHRLKREALAYKPGTIYALDPLE